MYKSGLAFNSQSPVARRAALSFALVGQVQGRIWQGLECVKEINVRFAKSEARCTMQDEYATLRDAVLAVTNDGDFQSCHLSPDTQLRVVVSKPNGSRVRYIPVTMFPAIADCVAAETLYVDSGEE